MSCFLETSIQEVTGADTEMKWGMRQERRTASIGFISVGHGDPVPLGGVLRDWRITPHTCVPKG